MLGGVGRAEPNSALTRFAGICELTRPYELWPEHVLHVQLTEQQFGRTGLWIVPFSFRLSSGVLC
jgi:hypothetical protein